MGCFVVLLALLSPRLALFALWLFGDLLGPRVRRLVAAASRLLPAAVDDARLCGDVELVERGVEGFEWFIVMLGFVFDLGSYSRGREYRSD